ncbi:hypothetical protein HY500_01230 [Candidatus Woesearchaeota archaeon]|nr:hypothetical protein [Candidatus Woesearchaeota archaeon]
MVYQDSLNQLGIIIEEVEKARDVKEIYPCEGINITSVYSLLAEHGEISDKLGIALIRSIHTAADSQRYRENPKGRKLVLRAVEAIGNVLKDRILEEKSLEKRV